MGRRRYFTMLILMLLSDGQLSFTNRHRGALEGNTAYYSTRNGYSTDIKLAIGVNKLTTLKISHGDTAGTVSEYTIGPSGTTGGGVLSNTLGVYIFSIPYTSPQDTEPENPTAPLAERYAREKQVKIEFGDYTACTHFTEATNSEITGFSAEGLPSLAIQIFSFENNLLSTLGLLPASVKELKAGGNLLTAEALSTGLALCRTTIELIHLSPNSLGSFVQTTPVQNVPMTQSYDLRQFPAAKEFFAQGCGVVELIIGPENVALELFMLTGINLAGRPLVRLPGGYIPPTTKKIKLGNSSANRADKLSTTLGLQTARDLNELDLQNCYPTTAQQGVSALQFRDLFFQNVVDLWNSPARNTPGTKTANFAGCSSVNAAGTVYPSGVQAYINDLIAGGWTITYNAS